MIKPTVGRMSWYYTSSNEHLTGSDSPPQPCASIITYVHSDKLVNLAVFAPDGTLHPRQFIKLLQDDDVHPSGEPYVQWMPYQIAQTAK